MDVEFGGIEGSVVLRFAENASLPSGVGCETVTIRVGPLVGEIRTVMGVDVPGIRGDLARALSGPELTGATQLASVEDDFRVRVELTRGKGSIRGRVEESFAADGGLDFVLSTDQTFVGSALNQLDALLATFPGLRDAPADESGR